MKKLFCIVLMVTLGSAFVLAFTAHAACPEGLTSYWKLDETTPGTYQDSVIGNDGVGNDNPTPTTGLVNGGQEFDGANTGITVTADGSFGWGKNESFTIEFWMKRDDPDSGGPAFTSNEVIVGRNQGDPATELHWWVGLGQTTGYARFVLIDRLGNEPERDLLGTADLADGIWHHLVAVRDAQLDQNLLYVDGELVDSIDFDYPAGFESTSADLNIGWMDGFQSEFRYNGTLDEIAIYNRALSEAEIQQHFNDAQDYCSLPTSNMAGAATSEVLANMNSATAVANLALALADPQYYPIASLYAQTATDNAQDAYDKASAAQNANTSFWGTYGIIYVQSELDFRSQAQTNIDQAVQAANSGDLVAAENYAILALSALSAADLYNGSAIWCLSMESDGATK